ncbi:uncharacterized protein LOC128217634 [Mya arenaria]|uniref:uncharacterized protein LOC128217634 n=1 Tax=Mya arenaria TaxID=6604 RepID=UPI0022E1AAE2|nr:uncharacterized protein LOC128217634 [Mya arenaria]
MSCFGGLMKEYDRVSLDRFDGRNLQSTVYFLSHLHEDHTKGLGVPILFKRLKSNKDIFLYCSEVTQVLLLASQKYRHLKPYIKSLPINTPTMIEIPDPLYEHNTTITVTLLPAFHCPGSVMFLLEGDEGTVLYTGDFRWEHFHMEHMHHLRSGEGVKKIKSLYIDTTFCTPDTLHIPSRHHCIDAVYELVREWTLLSPQHVVYIYLRAQYGHEPLLNAVAARLNKKVHVSGHKFEVYENIIEFAGNFTNKGRGTQIHACDKNCTVEVDGSIISCKDQHDPDKVLVILPTTMYFTQYQHITLDKMIKKMGDNFYRACYSFHSSYTEVKDLLSYLKPDAVFSNVKTLADATLAETQQRLTEMLSDCKNSESADVDVAMETKELGTLKTVGRKAAQKRKTRVSTSESESLDFGTPVKQTRQSLSQPESPSPSVTARRGKGRGRGRGKAESQGTVATRRSTRRSAVAAASLESEEVSPPSETTPKKKGKTVDRSPTPDLFPTPMKSEHSEISEPHSSYDGSFRSDSELDLLSSQKSLQQTSEVPSWSVGSFLAAVSSSSEDDTTAHRVCVLDDDEQGDEDFEDVSQVDGLVEDDEEELDLEAINTMSEAIAEKTTETQSSDSANGASPNIAVERIETDDSIKVNLGKAEPDSDATGQKIEETVKDDQILEIEQNIKEHVASSSNEEITKRTQKQKKKCDGKNEDGYENRETTEHGLDKPSEVNATGASGKSKTNDVLSDKKAETLEQMNEYSCDLFTDENHSIANNSEHKVKDTLVITAVSDYDNGNMKPNEGNNSGKIEIQNSSESSTQELTPNLTLHCSENSAITISSGVSTLSQKINSPGQLEDDNAIIINIESDSQDSVDGIDKNESDNINKEVTVVNVVTEAESREKDDASNKKEVARISKKIESNDVPTGIVEVKEAAESLTVTIDVRPDQDGGNALNVDLENSKDNGVELVNLEKDESTVPLEVSLQESASDDLKHKVDDVANEKEIKENLKEKEIKEEKQDDDAVIEIVDLTGDDFGVDRHAINTPLSGKKPIKISFGKSKDQIMKAKQAKETNKKIVVEEVIESSDSDTEWLSCSRGKETDAKKPSLKRTRRKDKHYYKEKQHSKKSEQMEETAKVLTEEEVRKQKEIEELKEIERQAVGFMLETDSESDIESSDPESPPSQALYDDYVELSSGDDGEKDGGVGGNSNSRNGRSGLDRSGTSGDHGSNNGTNSGDGGWLNTKRCGGNQTRNSENYVENVHVSEVSPNTSDNVDEGLQDTDVALMAGLIEPCYDASSVMESTINEKTPFKENINKQPEDTNVVNDNAETIQNETIASPLNDFKQSHDENVNEEISTSAHSEFEEINTVSIPGFGDIPESDIVQENIEIENMVEDNSLCESLVQHTGEISRNGKDALSESENTQNAVVHGDEVNLIPNIDKAKTDEKVTEEDNQNVAAVIDDENITDKETVLETIENKKETSPLVSKINEARESSDVVEVDACDDKQQEKQSKTGKKWSSLQMVKQIEKQNIIEKECSSIDKILEDQSCFDPSQPLPPGMEELPPLVSKNAQKSNAIEQFHDSFFNFKKIEKKNAAMAAQENNPVDDDNGNKEAKDAEQWERNVDEDDDVIVVEMDLDIGNESERSRKKKINRSRSKSRSSYSRSRSRSRGKYRRRYSRSRSRNRYRDRSGSESSSEMGISRTRRSRREQTKSGEYNKQSRSGNEERYQRTSTDISDKPNWSSIYRGHFCKKRKLYINKINSKHKSLQRYGKYSKTFQSDYEYQNTNKNQTNTAPGLNRFPPKQNRAQRPSESTYNQHQFGPTPQDNIQQNESPLSIQYYMQHPPPSGNPLPNHESVSQGMYSEQQNRPFPASSNITAPANFDISKLKATILSLTGLASSSASAASAVPIATSEKFTKETWGLNKAEKVNPAAKTNIFNKFKCSFRPLEAGQEGMVEDMKESSYITKTSTLFTGPLVSPVVTEAHTVAGAINVSGLTESLPQLINQLQSVQKLIENVKQGESHTPRSQTYGDRPYDQRDPHYEDRAYDRREPYFGREYHHGPEIERFEGIRRDRPHYPPDPYERSRRPEEYDRPQPYGEPRSYGQSREYDTFGPEPRLRDHNSRYPESDPYYADRYPPESAVPDRYNPIAPPFGPGNPPPPTRPLPLRDDPYAPSRPLPLRGDPYPPPPRRGDPGYSQHYGVGERDPYYR